MDEEQRQHEEREHRLLVIQLLESIIHRLNQPIEVTIHIVNEANPAVKVVLEPQTPKENI